MNTSFIPRKVNGKMELAGQTRLARFSLAAILVALATSVNPAAAQVTTPAQNSGSIGPILRTNVTSPTILPTDINPSVLNEDRASFGENFNINLLQRLPAPLYFSASAEASFRIESNPFQFPTKRTLLKKLPTGREFNALLPAQQFREISLVSRASDGQVINRILPNTTIGWALNNRTRIFGNHFLIRDTAMKSGALNSTVNSLSIGVQRDTPIGSHGNLQLELQTRELLQSNQQPVFDYLPAINYTHVVTPRMVFFSSALLQLRGKKPFQSPTKELDPFYSTGLLYTRRGWTFSAAGTLVQNFREPFGRNAIIRQDNYTIISDFEVSRALSPRIPGLQAFVRAEPIWNMHSRNTPGLAGMDMRVFWGLRGAVAKRPLTGVIQQIREDIEEEENTKGTGAPPTSSYVAPKSVIAKNLPLDDNERLFNSLASEAPSNKLVECNTRDKP
jgi:hypothetical protein